MTAIAITGMGLTGTLRLTWVQDNLAHVLDHSRTDETSGTWTGLACPGHGLALGTDVDDATLRRLAAGSEIADLTWEAPDELDGRTRPGIPGRHARASRRRIRARRTALGEPRGHLVTGLVSELRGARVHAEHRPDPVRAGQAAALGGGLFRAPHQSPWPSPPPRPQHRGRQFDYSRNGMSILVLLLYSGYAVGKVAVRFRSSTVPL